MVLWLSIKFLHTSQLFMVLVNIQVCQIEPGLFRDCDMLVRQMEGRMEILAVSAHVDADAHVDFDDHEDFQLNVSRQPSKAVLQISEGIQAISTRDRDAKEQVKQNNCSTCDAVVGDAKQYREHFKSDWHKHNLKRKTRQLPPLTAEECLADMEVGDSKADLEDYSF